jgi:hypothetical protein
VPPRIRFLFASLGVVFLLMAALPLYRELTRRRDIWWTPPNLMVSLDQGNDRVQIYARGEPLPALLAAGQIRLIDGQTSLVLAPGDLGLRFNNRDRLRAERLPIMLVYAAGCGVALVLILLVIGDRLAYRPEKP